MNDFAAQRKRMVREQLMERGITDTAVLQAMGTVPREDFVPISYREAAYMDGPLPIGAGQTISQPYVVALMLVQLQLQAEQRVLEIGTGSGYAAAVLSHIVHEVDTVERQHTLAWQAQMRFEQLGYGNIHVLEGDGTLGWADHAPYDRIIVAAGGPKVPRSLQMQLAVNGRLLMPVGKKRNQHLVLVERLAENEFRQRKLQPVRFVQLIGVEGFEGE